MEVNLDKLIEEIQEDDLSLIGPYRQQLYDQIGLTDLLKIPLRVFNRHTFNPLKAEWDEEWGTHVMEWNNNILEKVSFLNKEGQPNSFKNKPAIIKRGFYDESDYFLNWLEGGQKIQGDKAYFVNIIKQSIYLIKWKREDKSKPSSISFYSDKYKPSVNLKWKHKEFQFNDISATEKNPARKEKKLSLHVFHGEEKWSLDFYIKNNRKITLRMWRTKCKHEFHNIWGPAILVFWCPENLYNEFDLFNLIQGKEPNHPLLKKIQKWGPNETLDNLEQIYRQCYDLAMTNSVIIYENWMEDSVNIKNGLFCLVRSNAGEIVLEEFKEGLEGLTKIYYEGVILIKWTWIPNKKFSKDRIIDSVEWIKDSGTYDININEVKYTRNIRNYLCFSLFFKQLLRKTLPQPIWEEILENLPEIKEDIFEQLDHNTYYY